MRCASKVQRKKQGREPEGAIAGGGSYGRRQILTRSVFKHQILLQSEESCGSRTRIVNKGKVSVAGVAAAGQRLRAGDSVGASADLDRRVGFDGSDRRARVTFACCGCGCGCCACAGLCPLAVHLPPSTAPCHDLPLFLTLTSFASFCALTSSSCIWQTLSLLRARSALLTPSF
eukprot:1310109-Rhodomonas_salina.2